MISYGGVFTDMKDVNTKNENVYMYYRLYHEYEKKTLGYGLINKKNWGRKNCLPLEAFSEDKERWVLRMDSNIPLCIIWTTDVHSVAEALDILAKSIEESVTLFCSETDGAVCVIPGI
jgi:hypothetical protein